MRVLFVNHYLGYFGGVEQNIASTAEGLARRGHECHLAWGQEARSAPEFARLFASTVRSAEAGGEEGPPLLEIAERIGAETVYLHKLPFLPSALLASPGPRTVRMVHDHDLCCPRRHKYFAHNQKICQVPHSWRCWLDLGFVARDPSSPLGVRFQSLPAHKAEMKRNWLLDQLLVGSRFMRDELLMNGCPPRKVAILPPVVPWAEPPVAAGGASSAAEDAPPLILFVGQLIRGKGVDLLLDSLARVASPFRAVIIGDGNARPALEEQCRRLGLDDRVCFSGWVPNAELPAWYARARMVAVPSRWPEPFGMVGLEAMRQGRPVVAFQAGGIPDWLEDHVTGLLVGEQDVEAYARSVEHLLKNRDLARQMGEAARERAQREFSFDAYLTRLEGFLAASPRQLRQPRLEEAV